MNRRATLLGLTMRSPIGSQFSSDICRRQWIRHIFRTDWRESCCSGCPKFCSCSLLPTASTVAGGATAWRKGRGSASTCFCVFQIPPLEELHGPRSRRYLVGLCAKVWASEVRRACPQNPEGRGALMQKVLQLALSWFHPLEIFTRPSSEWLRNACYQCSVPSSHPNQCFLSFAAVCSRLWIGTDAGVVRLWDTFGMNTEGRWRISSHAITSIEQHPGSWGGLR